MPSVVPNPEDYFRQFIPERDPLLVELEAEAAAENIPIVGPLVGRLLFILARTSGAGAVLEMGTATGYSAIFIGRALDPRQGRLVTYESDPAMAARAAANIRRAGLDGIVEIKTGDAVAGVRRLANQFDLIFIDIGKADYETVLPDCARLLRKGGLLIADNVAFKDADSFNRAIFASSDWAAAHLLAFLPDHSPEQDGLCFALRL